MGATTYVGDPGGAARAGRDRVVTESLEVATLP